MQELASIQLDIEHLLYELACCISDLNHLRQHMSEDELNQSNKLAMKLQSSNQDNL